MPLLLLLASLLGAGAGAQQGAAWNSMFDGSKPPKGGGLEVYGSYGHGVWYYAPARLEFQGVDGTTSWPGARPHDSPDLHAIYNGKPDVAQFHARLGVVRPSGAGLELSYARPKLVVDPGAGPPPLRSDGLNLVMLSALHRLPLIGRPGSSKSVVFLAKAGAGIAFPIPDGPPRQGPQAWRPGGWAAGVEAAVRWTPLAPFYIELSENAFYGDFRVPTTDGQARCGVFSLGTMFGVGLSVPVKGKGGR